MAKSSEVFGSGSEKEFRIRPNPDQDPQQRHSGREVETVMPISSAAVKRMLLQVLHNRTGSNHSYVLNLYTISMGGPQKPTSLTLCLSCSSLIDHLGDSHTMPLVIWYFCYSGFAAWCSFVSELFFDIDENTTALRLFYV
jgi:hypothetical protein